MSMNVPDVFSKHNTIVAFWRTDTSEPLIDSVMEAQYWSIEMGTVPDSMDERFSKYKIDSFR